MQETGYIYRWRMGWQLGSIRLCGGTFSGLNVSFAGDDCAPNVLAVLNQGNVNLGRVCPPPGNSIQIQCTVEFDDGHLVARNITV